MFLNIKSLLYATLLHLFDRNSKISNIVTYDHNLK